jgi:tetratricopeptide (TPR) repeat protein
MSTPGAETQILCPDPETLGKLLRDELDPTEAGLVEEHVGVCPSCQRILERLVGSLPRLTDTLARSTGPHGRAADDDPPALPGYVPLGRIDAGGMGVVWRVRDLQFDRDLAVKVITSWGCAASGLRERFLAEAQICGQLTHPFIVPVHAMGRLADGRPYYTMKLVEGRTLAALLGEGPAPTGRMMEFVQVFGQVCQAVAFAHSRGIIHRDLKPENIMVGAHGEVQLMDWGLAKVLAEPSAGPRSGEGSESSVVESEWRENTRTLAGSVLGTVAYMAPEQARGLVEEVDRRSDVFGLGGLLCKILTGEPPYTGPNPEVVLLRAAEADLGETLSRLHDCGADPELIGLAERCLATRKADRPADAAAVAEQLAAYQASVQERLRQAELERATAQATAAAERTARRRTRALALAVLALVALAAGGGLWVQHLTWERRAEQARQEDALRQEVAADLGQAERLRRAGHFDASRELLEQARQRLAAGGPDNLRTQVEQCLADTALALRLDDTRQQASTWVEGKYDFAGATRGYAAALAEAGLGREEEDPGEVAARVRDSAVRAEVVAALDDWAGMTQDAARRAWLLAVARAADPDPERERLRQPGLWRDREALARLAQEPATAQLPPPLATALARTLKRGGGEAVPLLRAAQARHPDDFWINVALGEELFRVKQWDESIGYYRAALALRPRSTAVHNNLGGALASRGQVEAALRHFQEGLFIDPRNAKVHYNLGLVLTDRGQMEAAIGHYEQALRLDPNFASAHVNLGIALYGRGQREAATDHYKQALRIDPGYAEAHFSLGVALFDGGQAEAALRHYEEALRINPKHVKAHNNLGAILADRGRTEAAIGHYEQALRIQPNFAPAHVGLGAALEDRGQTEAAIGHYEQALRIDAKYADAHLNLGAALRARGEVEAAIRHYEEALRIAPNYAQAHVNLGIALESRGQATDAIHHYEEALRITPRYTKAHLNLGTALYRRGQAAEAIGHFEQALQIQPKNAEVHCKLGQMLLRQGRLEEALAHLQQGHQLGSKQPGWRYPSAQWVRHAERLLRLDRKLPAILAGQTQPADADEQLGLAEVCAIKKRDTAAARFYAAAFAARPPLADAHRYNAACAAARAGCGQGEDAARLSDTEKARLRQQAREWLGADLSLRAKHLTHDRRAAEEALRQWLKDPDLAGVRDPAALAQFPEEERREWRSLWQQIERLVGKPGK